MTRPILLAIIFLNIFTIGGCSSKQRVDEVSSSADSTSVVSKYADSIIVIPADDTLPFIDLAKRYPLKKIDLGEIADIQYVSLETTDKSLINFPMRIAIREGVITCYNYTDQDQEILIFNGDGTYFTKVSRTGAGPHEYRYIINSSVDFDNQLVYILDGTLPRRIKVYDFDGYMQREFTVADSPDISQMYLFDKDRLIVFCDPQGSMANKDKVGSHPYRFIDTTTGQTTPVDIEIPNPGSNSIRTYSDDHIRVSSFTMLPMLKSNNEVILSDYVHPIVYRKKGEHLYPLLKKPERNGSIGTNRELMSVIKAISDNYILFYVVEKHEDKKNGLVSPENGREVLFNRHTNEICEVDFINPDTGRKDLFLEDTDLPANKVVSIYSSELIDYLLEKGLLKGDLKKIAEKMDPEDNPVLAIITLK